MNQRVLLNHPENFKELSGFAEKIMGTLGWDFLR